MEIKDIKIHELRPREALKWSMMDLNVQTSINLLRVFTDEDIEGNFMTGIKPLQAEHLRAVFRVLKPFVIGEDPFDREKIWQNVFHYGEWNFGIGIGAALSALDIALWDIAGKALKMPIYKLLGAYTDKVRAYASTLMYPSIKDYVDFCTELVEKGYTAIKLHPWTDPKRDIQLCRAVRQAVGYDVELMLDGCMAYDRECALRVGREVDKLGFNWYEDPLINTDIQGCVELCKVLDTPIKIGEGLGDWIRGSPIYLIGEYIRRGALDIVGSIGDLIGGITSMRKIAAICEITGIRYEPHNYGTIPVQAAHFHIELASKNCQFFELPVPEGIMDVGMKDTFRIDKEGYVHAPIKPGLGVEIDWEKINELTLRVF